ncbi:hypothetical protein [Ktedonospora formicarum]|uniref:Uncharacterized protein n=1 Tax=Ktedonospora formicarum TaxID=2778364 RepID=A0A8J3MUL2_9CHLR|nr:hypothetical protein [Ktedonospora formicarum]GHO48340.1 hypothetical protein KSX_65030 [Ktedonospora formicarum]
MTKISKWFCGSLVLGLVGIGMLTMALLPQPDVIYWHGALDAPHRVASFDPYNSSNVVYPHGSQPDAVYPHGDVTYALYPYTSPNVIYPHN